MPQTIFTPLTFATVAVPDLIKRTREAIVRGTREAAFKAISVVQQEIDTADPRPLVNTAALRNSWSVTKVPKGWELKSSTPKRAAVMEFGARPHTPPLGPLLQWAKVKIRKGGVLRSRARERHERRRQGIVGRPSHSRPSTVFGAQRRGRTRGTRMDNAAMQLARAAQMAISRRGIAARDYYTKASLRFGGLIRDSVAAEIARVR
jgi:hypothetical protein